MGLFAKRGSISRKSVRLSAASYQIAPAQKFEYVKFRIHGFDADRSRFVLVHGCRNVSSKVARSLEQDAATFARRLACNGHIFSFDAAKLLTRGLHELRTLARQLLEYLMEIDSKRTGIKICILAHNTAIWVVQRAIIMWQYETPPGQVPIGIAAFGLPSNLQGIQSGEVEWESFRTALLKHLKCSHIAPSRLEPLDCSAISNTIADFSTFRTNLAKAGHQFLYKEHVCPDTRVCRASMLEA